MVDKLDIIDFKGEDDLVVTSSTYFLLDVWWRFCTGKSLYFIGCGLDREKAIQGQCKSVLGLSCGYQIGAGVELWLSNRCWVWVVAIKSMLGLSCGYLIQASLYRYVIPVYSSASFTNKGIGKTTHYVYKSLHLSVI